MIFEDYLAQISGPFEREGASICAKNCTASALVCKIVISSAAESSLSSIPSDDDQAGPHRNGD